MPQTWLPSERFNVCALMLDDHRLGNQRVDCIRILQSLSGYRVVTSSKWFDKNTGKTNTDHYPEDHWYVEKHLTGDYPVNKFWIGFEQLLQQYQHAMCAEHVRRFPEGVETCKAKFDFLYNRCYEGSDEDLPDWFGETAFHQYMQALLVSRAPEIYRAKFPGLLEDWTYKWQTLPPVSL